MRYSLLILMMLTGCTTTKMTEVQYKNIVIEPPSSLYDCPLPPIKPDPASLTDKKIAEYIKTLYKNNRTCVVSVTKIKQFVAEAKRLAK